MTRNSDLAALGAAGVSVWLDDLSRDRLRTGGPAELIDTTSVVRVTPNPMIFHHALSKWHTCDTQIREAGEELGTATGTQQKCCAGELGWYRR
jgi:transaldolase